MKHLLFLAHRIPYPPTKGDKVRSYHLLKYLAARYRVHLGAFVDDAADLEHAGVLRELCEECHLVSLNPALARVRSLAGLISGDPLTLPYYHSARMRRWVDEVLQAKSVECALVFSAAMAQYVMTATGVRRVADLVDVDSDKWRQYAATRHWPSSAIYRRESRTLLRYERRVARRFDATVFVSAAEAALFRELAPETSNKVWHVSNGVDFEYFSPERSYANPYGDGERVIVFTGAMDYWPNVDAVVWFSREVFPAIRRRLPNATFYVVGARPAPSVKDLARLPGVRVTGAVPDIRPYLAHGELAVAPLRMARGVQNKVLEAMAMARPVLASPQAVQGIEARHGSEVMVAADANAFVEQALHLLGQDNANPTGAVGRARVLASYSWDRSLSRFEGFLAHGMGAVASPRPGNTVPANRPSSGPV